VVEGAEVTVVTFGEFEETSWNWDKDKPIWLSSSGAITQSFPASGFALVLGQVISATKIFINKGNYIRI
jgi:hypothetical protein